MNRPQLLTVRARPAAPCLGLAAWAALAAAPQGMFPRLDWKGVALVVAFVVISVMLHEVAHGWVALKRGDATALEAGRLTLNPIAHIDPFKTLLLPALFYYMTGFIFGAARPVPVQMHRLRHPIRDMALVAVAGPATNVLLAMIFLLVWKTLIHFGVNAPGELAPEVMLACMLLNLVLAIFNMVPIPPLDGSRVMAWILPPPLREAYMGLERFSFVMILLILALVFAVPGFQVLLGRGIGELYRVIDLATGGAW